MTAWIGSGSSFSWIMSLALALSVWAEMWNRHRRWYPRLSQQKTRVRGRCKAGWGSRKGDRGRAQALRYETTICWVCWSNFGPREMAEKTKPVMPPRAELGPSRIHRTSSRCGAGHQRSPANPIWISTPGTARELTPADHKQRQNYRVIAVVRNHLRICWHGGEQEIRNHQPESDQESHSAHVDRLGATTSFSITMASA